MNVGIVCVPADQRACLMPMSCTFCFVRPADDSCVCTDHAVLRTQDTVDL